MHNASTASTTEAATVPETTSSVDSYFADHPTPPFLDNYKDRIQDLLDFHASSPRPIVLITSGGTTVPLETQTVRFIDNFSAGTRGATSAEHFIAQGYVVIFLHRRFSLLPYSRHYSHSTHCFLDFMRPSEDGKNIQVVDEYRPEMLQVLTRYREAQSKRRLLLLDFVTVSEYLHCLRASALLLAPLGPRVMYYLAAAVSDFFIPTKEMAQHKIQSGDGSLSLTMTQVPKFLSILVHSWATSSYIVSFKLETDPKMLLPKAQQALARYGHQVVVANLLHTRKERVVLISPVASTEYTSNPQYSSHTIDLAPGTEEIEEPLVEELVHRHEDWQSTSSS
ncbi:DNA/pantothenate metabolism flavo protein [Piptocephalis cylindrospora]|uniref:DNA/pantothenate metabolism flavo protein n=1 Tax=Piptocephalis cylindrospora TaxID=1907219 RepID=A0A4P9Y1L9_9FUNG|nr:DNA/pantothenate metabolism flavo protein [Piptocephalis cylindrospora]|eukprot:RKP12746.1 DNA/pantothenate metabolism flavo protein [Piptocephalis cylindrospora]